MSTADIAVELRALAADYRDKARRCIDAADLLEGPTETVPSTTGTAATLGEAFKAATDPTPKPKKAPAKRRPKPSVQADTSASSSSNVCSKCGMGFATPNGLSIHYGRRHGEKPSKADTAIRKLAAVPDPPASSSSVRLDATPASVMKLLADGSPWSVRAVADRLDIVPQIAEALLRQLATQGQVRRLSNGTYAK